MGESQDWQQAVVIGGRRLLGSFTFDDSSGAGTGSIAVTLLPYEDVVYLNVPPLPAGASFTVSAIETSTTGHTWYQETFGPQLGLIPIPVDPGLGAGWTISVQMAGAAAGALTWYVIAANEPGQVAVAPGPWPLPVRLATLAGAAIGPGQAAMAGSVPVAIASDQTPVPTLDSETILSSDGIGCTGKGNTVVVAAAGGTTVIRIRGVSIQAAALPTAFSTVDLRTLVPKAYWESALNATLVRDSYTFPGKGVRLPANTALQCNVGLAGLTIITNVLYVIDPT